MRRTEVMILAEGVLRLLLLDPSAPHNGFRRLLSGGASHPHQVTEVATCAQAIRMLGTTRVDAVVVATDSVGSAAELRRLRSAARDAALVMLRNREGERVPLSPGEVGVQSTIDVWTLDARTLWLTLQLAVERARHARLQAHADRLARTSGDDPTTGLPVAERLLEIVDTFVADAIRFGRPLTVALVTVDGVEGAEEATVERLVLGVARLLQKGVRTSDIMGRLGNQLLIAMPGTSGAQALRAVQRLQAVVPGSGASPVVTVGLATLRGLMSVDELVFTADRACQAALAQGPGGVLLETPVTAR